MEESEGTERDRGTEGETSYLDALIGGEEKTREKSLERKGIEAQRAKPPTPTRAIDELIGDEEQNEKTRKRNKQHADPQPSYRGPVGGLLRPVGITWWAYFFYLSTTLQTGFTSILDPM